MKKRLMGLLFVAMLALMLPAVAFGAEDVAEVNGQRYANVHEAIEAASAGDTVTLLCDVAMEKASADLPYGDFIEVTKDLTLDLGGHTLTGSDTWYAVQHTEGTLTIQNGRIEGDFGVCSWHDTMILGEGLTVDTVHDGVNVRYDSTVRITSGAKVKAGEIGVAIYAYGDNDAAATATLVVEGSVEGDLALHADSVGRARYDVRIEEGANLTGRHVGIYMTNDGLLTLSGGDVSGRAALAMRSGQFEMTAGSLTSTATYDDTAISQETDIAYDGSAIVVDSNTAAFDGNARIHIAGGRVESQHAAILREIGNDATSTNLSEVRLEGGSFLSAMDAVNVRSLAKDKIKVSGGSYTTSVKDYTASNIASELYNEGSYTYYTSREAAEAAKTDPNGVILDLTHDPVEPPESDWPFADVRESDWFYNDVVYVYQNGIIRGVSDTTFAPQATTTRGMIVTMLWRLEGEPKATAAAGFSDVKSGAYYEAAVNWANGNGVVSGMGEGRFAPDAAITREQLAAMLSRYSEYKGMDVSARADLSAYSDASSVSSYAQEVVEWAVAKGLISGVTETTLAPQGQATRAQVAAIMTRYCAMK